MINKQFYRSSKEFLRAFRWAATGSAAHSGSNLVNWNLTEASILNGVARADIKVGDEIGVKVYKNHNLAELRVIKRAVK